MYFFSGLRESLYWAPVSYRYYISFCIVFGSKGFLLKNSQDLYVNLCEFSYKYFSFAFQMKSSKLSWFIFHQNPLVPVLIAHLWIENICNFCYYLKQTLPLIYVKCHLEKGGIILSVQFALIEILLFLYW